ncbi:MAG TPA: dTDP-4-dehydrorhamnose 3,5-epimerase [Flexilinea sp.]|nr:dTDP-4-dehydrorhamnose 3,5-epimerase [Flexilinea sp.]
MAFKFEKCEIPGLLIVEADVFNDTRGFFIETYQQSAFINAGIDKPIVQIDHSRSKKNVVRGLHYQLNPMAQGKIVDVIDGEIFDVTVDLRKGSPSFGKWFGINLGIGQGKLLYIPEGFAHGVCALSETADIIYYCTQVYAPEYQRGILWNDPELDITWPVKKPVLSDKDKQLPLLNQADNNFVYEKIINT